MSADSAMPTKVPKRRVRDQREYMKAYYQRNKAKASAQAHAYYLANREHRIEMVRRYRLNNLEKVKAAQRRQRLRHPEKQKARFDRWVGANRERYKKWRKDYQRSHLEKWKANNQNRRALVRASVTNLRQIEAWMEDVLSKSHATCYWCGSKIAKPHIHFDHIVPLFKGGAHSIENLCVSCAPCNLSKHTKTVRAWVRIGQQVLEL